MLEIRGGYETKSKTFRLPGELVGELEKIAVKNKVSLNQLVIQCLEYALKEICEEQK